MNQLNLFRNVTTTSANTLAPHKTFRSATRAKLFGTSPNQSKCASRFGGFILFAAMCVAMFGFVSSAKAQATGGVHAWGKLFSNEIIIPAEAMNEVSAIAASVWVTSALKNGAVLAWGNNTFGQLDIPADALSGVTAIAGGAYYTIALKDGAVLAWGNNTFGQLDIPDAATSGVTAIAGGHAHTSALKAGAVLAWGNNGNGQCNIPVNALSGVTHIACGDFHTIALKNGEVLAWGRNDDGQCLGTDVSGDPLTSQVSDGTAPVQISGVTLTGVTAIAGGGAHTIALKDGAVLAWGSNGYGQCTIPVAAQSGVFAIGAGGAYSLALSQSPAISSVSPLGGPMTGGTPITITGGYFTGATSVKIDGVDATNVSVVSATSINANAPAGTLGSKTVEVTTPLGTDVKVNAYKYLSSAVLAWGYNAQGQCTIPDAALGGVSAIAGGSEHTIALKNGAVLAWGDDGYGQCTIPDSANSGVSAIAGGSSSEHTIALKDGAVLAWGRNIEDQCDIPDSAKSGVTAIAGGRLHTIALKNGEVLAWGINWFGQCLGTGSDGNPIYSTPTGDPVKIMGEVLTGVSAIAGGDEHTIALKNGEVLAWGNNYYGQCTIPVAAQSGVSAIAGGSGHTIALKNGEVLAWGDNWYGQCLGTGSNGNPITSTPTGDPVKIMGEVLTGVSAIAGGDYHTIALKNGEVLAWGAGKTNETSGGSSGREYGQCNIPDSAKSGVSAIAGGALHTIALKNGEVLAWGNNDNDQCNIPASANSGVSAIACGYAHTIALIGGTDCDINSVSDTDEIAQDPTLDRNGNGNLDRCDIRDNPALDRNVNGIPDSYEIAQNPLLDLNGNGVLDSYEIAQTPALDSNQNGILDLVELATANGQVTTLTSQNAALTAQLNCGDLNGDNEVNGADVGLQLMNYGPCPQ